MYACRYGGTAVDRYTMLLRDFSPLHRLGGAGTAFMYRWAASRQIYPAVFRLPCAGSGRSTNTRKDITGLLLESVRTAGWSPASATAILSGWHGGEAGLGGALFGSVSVYPSAMFDPLWMRVSYL